MKRSIVTIVVAVLLIVAVIVVMVINFSKYKENKYSKYYDIAEEKIIEQEKTSEDLNEYKTFVVMEKYGAKEENEKLYVYAYVCAENYYKDETGNVILHSGFSIPHRFEFVSGEYVGLTIPQDGSYYEESLNEMYPLSVKMQMDMSNDRYNLGDKTKQLAADYYGVSVEDIKYKTAE